MNLDSPQEKRASDPHDASSFEPYKYHGVWTDLSISQALQSEVGEFSPEDLHGLVGGQHECLLQLASQRELAEESTLRGLKEWYPLKDVMEAIQASLSPMLNSGVKSLL